MNVKGHGIKSVYCFSGGKLYLVCLVRDLQKRKFMTQKREGTIEMTMSLRNMIVPDSVYEVETP